MTKIKIDDKGFLWLLRKNELKKVYCPFDASAISMGPCGDWCAQFGEPRVVKFEDQHAIYDRICVGICQGKSLMCEPDEFEDARL